MTCQKLDGDSMQREKYNAVFKSVAEFFSVLSNSDRIRILTLLHERDMDVNELHTLLNLSQPRVSQQLKLLKLHHFVTERREGKHIFYGIKDEGIAKIVEQTLKLEAVELSSDKNTVMLINELVELWKERMKNINRNISTVILIISLTINPRILIEYLT